MSVAQYAALGRRAPAPRLKCPDCARNLAFDGSYPRSVREAGVVHRIFVRRARCAGCERSEALIPHFVVRQRRDSVSSVGAALLASYDIELPAGAAELYRGVPERTVRSWRQRFAERAGDLRGLLEALTAEMGGELAFRLSRGTSASDGALSAMGNLWRAARRRPGADVPGALPLANVVFGGGLLATRVVLPWPIVRSQVGHFQPP